MAIIFNIFNLQISVYSLTTCKCSCFFFPKSLLLFVLSISIKSGVHSHDCITNDLNFSQLSFFELMVAPLKTL